MNTKPAESETGQRPGRANVPGGRTVLAADIRLTGDLSSAGTVEILGEVSGDISAQTLIVGAEGQVKGSVRAETVSVIDPALGSSLEKLAAARAAWEAGGRGGPLLVDGCPGEDRCLSFTLRSSAIVAAEVNYDMLIIENGAQIDGRFARAKR